MSFYRQIFLDSTNLIILFVILALTIFALCRGVFVHKDVAVKAAETQGFTDVEVIDHDWFAVGFQGCGSGDAARFTINATNPSGSKVKCYICTGWLLKGATIRSN